MPAVLWWPDMKKLEVRTSRRTQMLNITPQVEAAVQEAGVTRGRVVVFVPHTTAGITINEDADPDVCHDILAQLDAMVPLTQPFYRHSEGNSAAHIKASLVGSSVTVLVEGSRLALGTWQGIFLCEFDGPRTRNVWVEVFPA